MFIPSWARAVRLVVVVAFLLVTRSAVATTYPFDIILDGLQETPPNASPANGAGFASLDDITGNLTLHVDFAGLVAPQTAAHIHQAPIGVPGPVIVPLPNGSPIDGVFALSGPQQASAIANGLYVNVHTTAFPGGEIRGQLILAPEPATLGLVSLGGIALIRRRRSAR